MNTYLSKEDAFGRQGLGGRVKFWSSHKEHIEFALDTLERYGDRSDLQLSSSGPRRGLDLLASRGFSTAFVTQFAFVDARPVDGKTTACALALSRKESVSIPDVTSSAIFAPTALRTLEAERVRTVHSTPMATAGQGKCIGVLSIHRARPGRVPNRATQAELGRIAGQTGAWVTWQRRTARLHALEDLHERAGGYPATG